MTKTTLPTYDINDITCADKTQLSEIDHHMVNTYGISIPQMMECAGLATAQTTRGCLNQTVKDKLILLFIGKGNNGGDALVAARHLCNWGARVAVILTFDLTELKEDSFHRIETITQLPIVVLHHHDDRVIDLLDSADFIIDGLLGFGLSGNPKDPIADCIKKMNASEKGILAIDIPSGLEASTGKVYAPCIHASVTLTFVSPKKGFLNKKALPYLGTILLSDIGVPKLLYDSLNLEIGHVFEHATIVGLKVSGQ